MAPKRKASEASAGGPPAKRPAKGKAPPVKSAVPPKPAPAKGKGGKEKRRFDCPKPASSGEALEVENRAGQESEIPNFKASYLGRFPLVSADSWTSDHLSERSRSVDAFPGTRARGTLTLKRR